jgi:hypothetical protein
VATRGWQDVEGAKNREEGAGLATGRRQQSEALERSERLREDRSEK